MRSVGIAFAWLVFSLFAGAGIAFAHSELVSSDPAADATLDAPPRQVSLTFDQRIEDVFAYVTVTGDGARQWAAPDPVVDGNTVRATVTAGLPAGRYTVAYRVVSEDGHPIEGSFAFTLSSATVQGAPDGAAAASSAETDKPKTNYTWIFGSAAAGLFVAGVIVVFRGGRHRDRS